MSVHHLSRKMEDLFFAQRDAELQRERRTLEAMEETREALAEASGITDPGVLDRLIALDIRPETAASLAMIPLVAVAWADGTADEREKRAILAAARGQGMTAGSVDYRILECWLKQPPPPELRGAWGQYVRALCAKLTAEEARRLRDELLGHARAVAKSSGGFLGLTDPVSDEERAVLKDLESAFPAP